MTCSVRIGYIQQSKHCHSSKQGQWNWNWIKFCLSLIFCLYHRSNCLNVLVSSSPLIYTLTKLLIFQLGSYFSIGNVYSCAKTSELIYWFVKFYLLTLIRRQRTYVESCSESFWIQLYLYSGGKRFRWTTIIAKGKNNFIETEN